MRRILVFLLTLALVPAGLRAQSPDPLITSARQFVAEGNHDTAIAMLRGGLASRPADAALKAELASALQGKAVSLQKQIAALQQEIRTLLPELSAAGLTRPSSTQASAGAACPGAAPVRVGGAIGPPMKTRDVRPVYPPKAHEERVQGVVIAEVTIGCDGTVADAKVLRGVPLLNDAALAAIREWQYTATLLNGVPVPVIMTVTMTFQVFR
ncbi:MAG: TonB family protein [Acidobacteriota bacterium]|nr:TonB family protein [Acidobacteriota bacterium]